MDVHRREPLADDWITCAPKPAGQAEQLLPGSADPAVTTAAALEAQRGESYLPALADIAQPQLVGNPYVGEEHFVERRPAGHLLDRTDLDTRRIERNEERCHPGVLGERRVAPGDELAPASELRPRAPYLLAIDHPVVAIPLRPGRQARQIGARARLGKQLAAQFLGAQEPAHEPGTLLGRAEDADGWRDQVDGHRECLMCLRRGEALF